MNSTLLRQLAAIGLTAALITGCSEQTSAPEQRAAQEPAAPYEDTLRLALETAQPGDVIKIPEGRHTFTRGLTLNTDGVTIRGAGMDASVLERLKCCTVC